MFIGHAALALAARPLAPRAHLGVALAATYWLDLVWPILVLAGVERVEVAPGITAFTPLDFVHYPWTHSLVAALAWSALFALGCWKLGGRAALVMGLLVLSHWGLDALSHRPDLPLYPGGSELVGLGLWNSLPGTLAVELGVFVLGIILYLRCTRPLDRTGVVALWSLVGFLLVVYLVNLTGPPPDSVAAIGWVGQAQWLLVAWGYWIDRHRRTVGA